MKYCNPVIPGFFPDPSICKANGKYYMVNSSFQYFPGVPIHESVDLINWKLIGHVLTRPSQLPLKDAGNSGGIFATTIRFNKGRFYMVTTNVSFGGNFYVWTDDIYGEWSDPIWIDQDGIDPSFYFECDTCYFMTNGTDDEGNGGIIQCEIDIETGKILTKKKRIWTGCGGRYLEGPHLYKFKDTYYILAAEGGTEYGHMVIMATGKTPYGPFTAVENNPVLTNRNLGGYEIQGVGHGDIVEDDKGNFWMVHLAYRQLGQWMMFHTTGRETYFVPMEIDGDKIKVGDNGTTRFEFDTDKITAVQESPNKTYTFENTHLNMEWIHIREPKTENYEFKNNAYYLKGTDEGICKDLSNPTFMGMRLKEMKGELNCNVKPGTGIGGITLYMDNEHHYDICVAKENENLHVTHRCVIGDVNYIKKEVYIKNSKKCVINIKFEPEYFSFAVKENGKEYDLGCGRARYLATEVTCGFTGVMVGLFAEDESKEKIPVEFRDFKFVTKR